MKDIKITTPEGYEVDKENSTFEHIVFKEIDKTLTYEDVAKKLFKEDVYYTTSSGFVDKTPIDGLMGLGTYDPNNAVTEAQLKSILALNKLCNVAKFLNKGWIPDWTYSEDNGNRKYYIFMQNSEGGRDRPIAIYFNYKQQSGCVYFATKLLAQQAIDILGEDEVRKALTLNH